MNPRSTRTKAQTQGEYTRRLKLRNGRRLLEYLLDHPCVDCGNPDLRVLEFDHRADETKSYNISEMINQNRRWEAILDEIEKCNVRCRNCHVIRTHEVNDSWRHRVWVDLMTEGLLR